MNLYQSTKMTLWHAHFANVAILNVIWQEINISNLMIMIYVYHDDVIKWKHFPRYWPFVHGIHRCPVNSLHKGQWRGALMFSLICVWINGWVNNREAGDLKRHRAHYDVIVMIYIDIYILCSVLYRVSAAEVLSVCKHTEGERKWWQFCRQHFKTQLRISFLFELSLFWIKIRWWIGAEQATNHNLNQRRSS